jgi:multidrug transporter EmrE-like cation transporter
MSLTNFLIILAGVLLNAVGQLALKFGSIKINEYGSAPDIISLLEKYLNTPIVIGLACYVLSVATWVVALTRVDVSVAYPMLSIGYVVVAILAYLFFGEVITTQKVLAMGVIVVGVILLARS